MPFTFLLIDCTHPSTCPIGPAHPAPPCPLFDPSPRPLPWLPPAPPPSSCVGVWLVGGCIDQRGACLPRSPPPRTTRHQTPPPLPPRPEWVPAMCILTHRASSYLLSPHASSILPPSTQDQNPGFLELFQSMWKKICFVWGILLLLFFPLMTTTGEQNLNIYSQWLSFHSFREQGRLQKMQEATKGTLSHVRDAVSSVTSWWNMEVISKL